MESPIVREIVSDTSSESMVMICGLPVGQDAAAVVFGSLDRAGIGVDMIVQGVSKEDVIDISFTVSRQDGKRTLNIISAVLQEMETGRVSLDEKVARVTLLGAALDSNIAARMFRVLADCGLNIKIISKSTVTIICVVTGNEPGKAVPVLEEEFEREMSIPDAVVGDYQLLVAD